MFVRHYMVKAQEAEAVANASDDPRERRRWEAIAFEYRRLATALAAHAKTTSLLKPESANPPTPPEVHPPGRAAR